MIRATVRLAFRLALVVALLFVVAWTTKAVGVGPRAHFPVRCHRLGDVVRCKPIRPTPSGCLDLGFYPDGTPIVDCSGKGS